MVLTEGTDKMFTIIGHSSPITKNNLAFHVIDGGVLHLPENTSRHSPIWIKVEVSNLESTKEEMGEVY